MKVIVNKKEIELEIANTFFKKLKGFMGKKNIHTCLRFKTNSIHTFFMKENIDVLLCDKNNKILYFYHNLSKNKIILPKKKVTKVFELPVDYFNIKLNDTVKIIK